MTISVSIQATLLNSANNFVLALYDASAPTVLLESQVPSKPYATPSFQVTFSYNCLVGHLYNIKLWESADTTPSGTVRNSHTQSVNKDQTTINLRGTEYLQEGVTSGLTAGATSYDNIAWPGWVYTIERIGTGTMVPLTAGESDPNYSAKSTGGFDLLQSGDTIQSGEKFVVRFEPQVAGAAPPTGNPSFLFSSGQIITANKTLLASDSGQALFIQSSSTQIVINMPDISTVSDYTPFYIYSFGGLHKNVVINAAAKIQYQIIAGTTQVNQIILGQNEKVTFFKANGVWNVEDTLPGVQGVGELIYQFLYAPINSLPCAGQLVNRADYPRLWAFVSNLTNGVVTETSWTSTFVIVDGQTLYTNKGNFSTGDGSTTFRLPLLYGQVLKGVDGTTRFPGSFEMDQIITHEHEQTIGQLPTNIFGNGATRNIGNYKGMSTLKTDLTSPPVNSDGTTLQRMGTENKIRNTGAFALVRI